jgi:hypothetical protein
MNPSLKPYLIRLPILLPIATMLLYIVLGAIGFPAWAHIGLAWLEIIIFLPGAILVNKLYYQRVIVMVALAVAGNEAAARLTAAIMENGIAGPGLTLWTAMLISIGVKLFAIWCVYKAMRPILLTSTK